MNRRSFIKLLAIQSLSLLIGKKAYSSQIKDKKIEVVLTIDDGPRKTMNKTLQELEKRKENSAIFYVLGKNLENDYSKFLAKKALIAGHILGNHSYTHPEFSKITFQRAKEEILKTEKLIELIYNEANIPKEKKLFRFPYGSRNVQVEKYLKEEGYCIQGWDIDSNDWRYYSSKNKFTLSSIIKNCEKAKNGDTILLHELPITSEFIVPFFADSEKYKLIVP